MGKTKIYLIRHGESLGNYTNTFLGHTNLDLTEMGKMQAERTAQYLKSITPDVIYASDLLRAYNTAMPTAKYHGMDIIKNEDLREIFAGDWEHIPFATLEEKYPESYPVWLNDMDLAHPDNGESVKALQTRIVAVLTKIAKENEGKTVFVFTHATPIRVFAAYCGDLGTHKIKDVPWARNTSVTYAEYENGEFHIIEYGKDDFLGDIRTYLPKNV